ncbi:MAG: HIRAN domain-containing protein [Betaproteobacteria bacterium]|nr:HIRAN domain-containing protein [Betaproteobacteria bacterium]
MTTTIALPDTDLSRQLMQHGLGGSGLPIPFLGREIELLVTYIAGMEHHNSQEQARALPLEGECTLRREPDNAHDERAIAVHWQGRRIGYVPRRSNPVLAALMDAGKLLRARLLATRPKCPAWMVKQEGLDREIRILLAEL